MFSRSDGPNIDKYLVYRRSEVSHFTIRHEVASMVFEIMSTCFLLLLKIFESRYRLRLKTSFIGIESKKLI